MASSFKFSNVADLGYTRKLDRIKEFGIKVYFDDNPIYVNYLRNEGVLVFQPIMSDAYIDEFSKKDKYFTCHFQNGQFDYTKEIK